MFNFQHTRPLADLLTVSRVIMGFGLAGLGMILGPDALPLAVLTVLLCWFTDFVDGPLARHDPNNQITWVGSHDAEADLTTSVGVTAYLVFSDYLSGWVGSAIVLALLGTWVLHSHQLAWPIYALPFVIFGSVAFHEAAFFGWLSIGYLLIVLAVRWPRLRQEFLPEFFQAVGSFLGKGSRPD